MQMRFIQLSPLQTCCVTTPPTKSIVMSSTSIHNISIIRSDIGFAATSSFLDASVFLLALSLNVIQRFLTLVKTMLEYDSSYGSDRISRHIRDVLGLYFCEAGSYMRKNPRSYRTASGIG